MEEDGNLEDRNRQPMCPEVSSAQLLWGVVGNCRCNSTRGSSSDISFTLV